MVRSRMLLSCVLVLVWAGTASAAINFFKPNPTTVSPRPSFLAVADFNGDNRADVAVSSPRSGEINVLLGSPDGVMSGTVFRFGQLLGGIAAGDLNQDGKPDIAVTDERSNGVYVLLNLGDAAFSTPALRTVGRDPSAVAIGDFDGVNGNDLAVCDRAQNPGRVFILTNDGRPTPNFRPGSDYPVGQGPEEILAVDLNGDNAPDIVTLNQGGTRVKDVTVLLFDRVSQNLPIFIPLPNFGVGERPENMVAGDFNGDGSNDLALANRGLTALDSQIEFLFNRGDGFMIRVDPISLQCPFFTADRGCPPRALGAGDFDADGKIDLAVAQVDPRDNSLGDLLAIYVGTGDGFYVPGPVFETDASPGSMAIADTAGVSDEDSSRPDGLTDIMIGSDRATTIQVFVNRSTVALGGNVPGQTCDVDEECTTGLCIDDVCCRVACEEAELCNVPGFEGTCQPLEDNRPPGFPCEDGDQCQSGFCTNETCCQANPCPQGARCDIPGSEGNCTAPLPDGAECDTNDHCRSTNCVDGICCDTDCPDGRCDVPEKEGVCTTSLVNGETCSLDDQCESGICDIVERICCAEVCDTNEQCASDGSGCGPSANTPQITPGVDGAPCTNDNDCDSSFCTDDVCCELQECEPDEFCQGGTGECVVGAPSPTPTPTTPGTPTPTATCPSGCTCVGGVVACAGRSGGCSTTGGTGGSETTPAETFLALLLPLALFLVRRGRVMAAARQMNRRGA